MLKIIERGIVHGDPSELSDLLWRRFSGDPLDSPFDPTRDDPPRAILTSLFQQLEAEKRHGELKVLSAAVTKLVGTRVIDAVDKMFPLRDEAGSAAPWLTEVFRYIEETTAAGMKKELFYVGTKIITNVDVSEFSRVLWYAYLRAIVKHFPTNKKTELFCGQALISRSAGNETVYAIANLAPELYIRKILPNYCWTLEDQRHLDRSIAARIRDTTRVAFSRVSEMNGSQAVADLMEALSGKLQHMVTFNCASELIIAVTQGLSRAGVPARRIYELEQNMWIVYPHKNVLTSPSHQQARKELSQQLREYVQVSVPMRFPTIRMNSFPYAEAGLLRVFRIAAKIMFDVDIQVEPVEYNQVREALLINKIQLAAHNPSIANQSVNFGGHPEAHDRKLLVSSEPLATFRDYQLMVSIPFLAELTTKSDISEDAKALAEQLLETEATELEILRPRRDGLAELLRHGRISVLGGSDTEEVIRKELGKLGIDIQISVLDLEPDEGLERLLDGSVLFYVGGALQVSYGESIFQNRIKKCASMPHSRLKVNFYVEKEQYNNNKSEYELLLKTWNGVSWLWKNLCDVGSASRKYQSVLSEMQKDVVISLNQDRGILHGFVSTFDYLKRIIEEHDIIHQIREQKPRFIDMDPAEPITTGLTIVNTVREMRLENKDRGAS